MSDATDRVQLNFRHTEAEYLAATRLYFWHSKEVLMRLIVSYVLFAAVLLLLPLMMGFSLPIWFNLALMCLGALAWFHGYVVDLPRRYFRGDPKFREDYHLTFSDAGVEFQTQNMSSMIAWSYYTGVIENDKFYLLIYGKNINAVSILPKRVFEDSKQETDFRQLLRRNLDHTLKLSEGERETPVYVPKSLEPPDWR
jgi:YcxB-like protein